MVKAVTKLKKASQIGQTLPSAVMELHQEGLLTTGLPRLVYLPVARHYYTVSKCISPAEDSGVHRQCRAPQTLLMSCRVQSAQFTLHCWQFTVQTSLCTVHSALLTVHCANWAVHSTHQKIAETHRYKHLDHVFGEDRWGEEWGGEDW